MDVISGIILGFVLGVIFAFWHDDLKTRPPKVKHYDLVYDGKLITTRGATLIYEDSSRKLYQTKTGLYFWLCLHSVGIFGISWLSTWCISCGPPFSKDWAIRELKARINIANNVHISQILKDHFGVDYKLKTY